MNSGTYNRTKDQGLTLNASFDYKPAFIKGLTARVQFGKSNRSGSGKEYYVPYNTYDFVKYGNNSQLYSSTVSTVKKISNTDRLYESVNYANSYQLISSLNYTRRFGLHDISLLVAAEQSESEGDNYSTYRDIALIPGVDQFFAYPIASTQLGSASPTEAGKLSYLGRFNYAYNNKYLLEVIARYDGSANFPPDTRWGIFPSVGLGWKISEEDFFRNNVPFINSLRLRANVGRVGDDRIRGYQFRSRFSPTSGILLGGGLSNGLDNNLVPNPYITWEKAFTQNYGFDATFLNNKMTMGVDVWKRHTYDGLVSTTSALPWTTGATAPDENYAIVDAWGIEASLGYHGTINKDMSYWVDANFGSSANMLIRTFQQASNVGTYQDVIGKTMGRQDGYIAKGIIRTQAEVDAILSKNPNYTISGSKPRVGYLDFVDVNNDGKIDGNDITKLRDKASSIFGMGFTLGFSYKTLRLSTNLNLAVGGYVYYDAIAKTPPTLTQNAAAFWKDHWTPDNPNAAFPSFDAPLAKENSTFWERPGTQMRVNNMTLSFAMPKGLAQRLGIPDFRAYLSGTNLWNIINPFDYKDPTQSNFINYPTLRTFSLGINMTL
jgi:TonB-linked SusC/RagA family outer membrane protein